MRYKHILITLENYQTLKKLGGTGDSFNDVITNMLKKMNSLQQSSSGVGTPEEIVVNSTQSYPKEDDCNE
jgi:predicted CopG family antitoxin